ncbi:response regulator transcription factor [Candidatus Contubernalis alkaliaceticus]|uniref:response regulator transcription factor n=1 Tax=Candidatus Contubernalis alkaliaceticus TaxID=338645 RepID=UPI001F4BE5C4|nr:response regulator [Candidatus Contubernalis alkalaceticus]UNC92257.1 response regulator [Candidatus Contubernalis alkalaceticus]
MSQKILLVEDEKNIIIALKLCLINYGYEVLLAEDGITAVETALKELPDLVLLDIIIPKLNGFLVCEALKENDLTKGIPIIMLSAKAQEEDIKKARDCGASEYLVKPLKPEELIKQIKKYTE